MSNDATYFAARSTEERQRAMAAGDPRVRRVHLELAAKYALLAGAEGAAAANDRPEEAQRLA